MQWLGLIVVLAVFPPCFTGYEYVTPTDYNSEKVTTTTCSNGKKKIMEDMKSDKLKMDSFFLLAKEMCCRASWF